MTVNAKYEHHTAKLPLVIVKGDRPALLGHNWLNKFRFNWNNILSVGATGGTMNADVAAVLQRHNAVFEEGPNTIREFKASIRIKRDTQTIWVWSFLRKLDLCLMHERSQLKWN